MLEAMASGLLVVGTTRGGSGEALVDGRTGITFPDGSSEALADILERFLANRSGAGQLAAAGQETVIQNFNIDVSVGRIEAYLSSLLWDSDQEENR
jgi:glycogen(starch) synthase